MREHRGRETGPPKSTRLVTWCMCSGSPREEKKVDPGERNGGRTAKWKAAMSRSRTSACRRMTEFVGIHAGGVVESSHRASP